MINNKEVVIFSFVVALLILNLSVSVSQSVDKTLSPYFYVENADPALDAMPLKATEVEVYISGVIAEINITQVYENKGSKPINATYIFPASTRAAIHFMQMIIGDNIVTAKIKERQQAKVEYEKAVKEGKSASLLEQNRPNVFTMKIGNIMPGDVIKVKLSYTELLVPIDGLYEFVFPTVVGPRYSNEKKSEASEYDSFVETPYLKEGKSSDVKFNINVRLSTGVPIQEIVSPSHHILMDWKTGSDVIIRLDDYEDGANNRDCIIRYKLQDKEISTGLLLYKGEKENFFLYMMQPPDRVRNDVIQPREYIFVVDVSGSMHGFPIEVSKSLLKQLLGNLKSSDKFNVLLFESNTSVMFPESIFATKENIDNAIRFIDSVEGSGGTEIGKAIEHALAIRRDEHYSRSIVIVTDGYISFENTIFDLIRNNLNNANFFAFGIGSSVNRYLIDGIAKVSESESFVVTKSIEAKYVANNFLKYIP